MAGPIIDPYRFAGVVITLVDDSADDTDLTTYSFASQAFGAEAVDRVIILTIHARSTGSITISSVTISGVSATARATAINSGSGSDIAAIYTAALPTGTIGTVEVVFSGGAVRCGIGVYRMVGGSEVPANNYTDTTLGGQTLSVSADVSANGAIVGAGFGASAGTASTTWAGIAEDVDSGFAESSASCRTSAHLEFAAAQAGLTISATFDAGIARAALAVSAFGPA
jgi:hypothetical protein